MPEDEDFQLQAALEASLDGPRAGFPMPLPRAGPAVAGGSGSARSPGATMGFPMLPPLTVPPPVPPPSTRPTDQPMENPVAASMARNQAMLERMRREQEVALREHYHEEASRFDGLLGRPYPRAGSHVEDEEEQLRRAIAESEAMARGEGHAQAGTNSDAKETEARSENTQARGWTRESVHGGRVYDDEDAELQAALQASLETAPPGAHTPGTATPPPPRAAPTRRSPYTARSTAGPITEPLAGADEDDEDDDELYSGDDEDDTATEETLSDADMPPQDENVDIEEMRRRRLARFSGS